MTTEVALSLVEVRLRLPLVVFLRWLSRLDRWRIAGQTQWRQVNGTVTTTETSSPFNLYIADSYGTTP